MTENKAQKYGQVRSGNEFILMQNVRDDFEGIAYSGNTFRVYGDGIWKDTSEHAVGKKIQDELWAAGEAGAVEPSYRTTQNVKGLLKDNVYVEEDVWDKQKNIIVLRNTAMDLDTMEPTPHNADHKATRAVPYTYDRKATAPTWKQVLGDLLSEDERSFFQEFAGYCLTHSVKHQMALWMVGPRGCGKSTLTAGLETMLGDLAGTLNLDQVKSQFGLSGIHGKTLLTCTEMPSGHLKAAHVLNALITGDRVTIEAKYKSSYGYNNTAKLMWSMNALPGLYDASNGIFRRAKILYVEGIPAKKRDPDVIERVKLEGPGILNWALRGWERLNERGYFDYPQSIIKATEDFKGDNDLQARFLEDRAERAPSQQLFYTNEYVAYAQELTQAFNEWAANNGHKATGTTAGLAKDWKRLGLEKGDRKTKGIPYYGVKLIG